MEGRVAVVTGATSGIGREVARGLARQGAAVVVVGRGEDRVTEAARAIVAETGSPAAEPVAVSDLALLSEVRRVASVLAGRYPRIHVLVNNAGALFMRREVTSEGTERTFALNVLSPFLLTSLLAPQLRAGAPARVVNIASEAHRGRQVNFGDLQMAQTYRGYQAYGQSKLELVLLTREMSRRLNPAQVTVNAVHPGFVRSGFGQNNGGGTALTIRFFSRLFGRSLARGADTPIWLASDPGLAGVTGAYFSDRRQLPGSAASQDRQAAERLYGVVRELTQAPELPVRVGP